MDKYQQLDEGQIFNPIQIQGLCTKKKITDESRVTFRIHSVADIVKLRPC